MNCEDFETHVNDLAREQIMEATVRAHGPSPLRRMRSLRATAGR